MSPDPGKALPTLHSVRRMSNLVAAAGEINRSAVGIDSIRFEAYANPRDYVRWDPNLLNVDPQLEPLKALQYSLVYGSIPDATELIPVRGRLVERGTVENRIRERAFLRKLNPTLDRYFSDGSWGYRPHRSAETAILRVRTAIRNGCHWALKIDFQHFFRHIDRSILERELRRTIPDGALCEALLNAVAPVVLVGGHSMFRQNGLPEGNGVSPFLSNLYLSPLDQACSRFSYFRYADDVLVLGRTGGEVQEALELVRALAATLCLSLHPKKTTICDLHREPVVFLGYELRGGNVWPSSKAIEQFKNKLLLRRQEDRSQLMRAFVRRFKIGRVRKLFRRLDRKLVQLYPPGVTLGGLLEESAVAAEPVNKQRITATVPMVCGQIATTRVPEGEAAI